MDIETILKQIIAVESTSALSNEPIVDLIISLVDSHDVAVHKLPSHQEGKFNLLLTKGKPSVKGISLCGHLDTVPATGDWESTPYELSQRGDNWYARGSCDMKGFVAIALHTIINSTVNNGCLAVLLLCDEEVGSLGAKHLVETGLPIDIPNSVIIGEPTSLNIVRLHKGHISLSLAIEGISAHTGSPHLGKNALVEGARLIEKLHLYAKELEEVRTPCSEFFPKLLSFPILTISKINSGTAINVVPDYCEIAMGLRLLPDQDKHTVIGQIESIIKEHCALPWKFTELSDNPTMLTCSEAPINVMLSSIVGQEESHGVSYGSDGGYLSRMGFECVLFGPGDIAIAHKPNEFVPIEEVHECADVINEVVRKSC
ncbi:MAG: hypothetical protein CMJ38_07310 [Phycisphaerae bacterium]|nr:hypothetical protein [Phycisphaerae bacterium]